MRVPRLVLLAAAAALLPSCGDRHLVVNVDVLSYLNPSLTQTSFGPVPAVPGGFYSGEQPLVQDRDVNLVEGLNTVAQVQDVTVSMTSVTSASSGDGADTVRVYISDASVDPLTTAPVVVLPITLTSGVSDTANVTLDGDQRIIQLFDGKRMRVTVTTALRGPSSGADLSGDLKVTALQAVVVAAHKGSL